MSSLRSRIIRHFVPIRCYAQRTISAQHLIGRMGGGGSIQEVRAEIDARAGKGIHIPRGAVSRELVAVTVPAEWIEPRKTASRRAILYLHGGGYTLCSPATHRGLAGRLALTCDARILLIAYRLAPDNPFPAALEDALIAYHWLLAEGISAEQIALGGDSAGGGLVLSTVVSLREAGETLPAALFLLSPWTDLTFSGESMRTRKKIDPMFGGDSGSSFAPAYVGTHDPAHPLISPLFADLHGLPPTLIQVGNDEILLSDSTRLEEKMKAMGVDARLEVWDGMWHVFQVFAPWVPESGQAIKNIGRFVSERIQP